MLGQQRDRGGTAAADPATASQAFKHRGRNGPERRRRKGILPQLVFREDDFCGGRRRRLASYS